MFYANINDNQIVPFGTAYLRVQPHGVVCSRRKEPRLRWMEHHIECAKIINTFVVFKSPQRNNQRILQQVTVGKE